MNYSFLSLFALSLTLVACDEPKVEPPIEEPTAALDVNAALTPLNVSDTDFARYALVAMVPNPGSAFPFGAAVKLGEWLPTQAATEIDRDADCVPAFTSAWSLKHTQQAGHQALSIELKRTTLFGRVGSERLEIRDQSGAVEVNAGAPRLPAVYLGRKGAERRLLICDASSIETSSPLSDEAKQIERDLLSALLAEAPEDNTQVPSGEAWGQFLDVFWAQPRPEAGLASLYAAALASHDRRYLFARPALRSLAAP